MEKEKNKLRIGIDLDDVVFEFVKTLIDEYEKKQGIKIKYEDVFSYYFPEVFERSHEEIKNIINEIFDYEKIVKMNLCNFAYESIKRISDKHEVYFITSRFNNKDATIRSLEKNFKNLYSEVIFSSNPYVNTLGKSKGKICEELCIDFMIEDSKEHSINCAKNGIKTFLLDKPWNKDYEEHKNIIKVKDWNEILYKIDEGLI